MRPLEASPSPEASAPPDKLSDIDDIPSSPFSEGVGGGIVYDRAATIAAITDYYIFLTKMYIKESQIIYPSPQGWPSIINADPALLYSFGKSDEVLALLAHLPYIRAMGNNYDDADGASDCLFADWQSLIQNAESDGEGLRLRTEKSGFYEISPPHVLSLTAGHRENFVLVLDTKLGIIHWDTCPHRIWEEGHHNCVAYEPEFESRDVPEAEVDWRCDAKTWAIPDFFEILKRQFVTLHWIPTCPYSVRSSPGWYNEGDENMVSVLRGIYRQHGWPDLAIYKKSECLEAVRKVIQENYPHEYCGRGGCRERT